MHAIPVSICETISALLEIVAFFCVTVELYGRNRLRKAHDALLERLSTLSIVTHEAAKEQKGEYSYWATASSSLQLS